MAKVEFSKWNGKIKPGDSLEKIVAKSLNQRISAVRYYLRLAAQRPHEDSEYVHQLRAWSRRSVAALQLYRECLQKKHSVRLNKYLKKIRKAAGNARDYDVLIKKYKVNDNNETGRFVEFLQEKRELSQAPIEKIFGKLEKGKELNKQLEFIKQKLQTDTSSKVKEEAWRFDEWANSRIHPLMTQFFDSIPSKINDLQQLHTFRIHGKTLRYAMELIAAAFPKKFRKELYPEIETLLTKLGAINDSAVMLIRLENWIESSTEKELFTIFEKLYACEEVNLKAELDDFNDWWNPQHIKSLHKKFDDLLYNEYQQAVT